MVLAPQTPSILLNGTEDLARDYAHFRAGLTVFPDLSVKVIASGANALPGETTSSEHHGTSSTKPLPSILLNCTECYEILRPFFLIFLIPLLTCFLSLCLN